MSLLGQPAPDFNLKDSDHNWVRLSDLRGKKVILAFYPAAFTGVCEKEVCTFQEDLSALRGAGAEVFGVSVDAPFSNAVFRSQTGAEYALLSDPAGEVIKAYDVVFPDFAGIAGYDVAKRSVFIVDEQGTVSYEWIAPNPGVEPDYAAVKAAL
jgi:peroxiredoxin